MEKIDEQICWYEENANSLYEDLVIIELEKINSLYDRYEDHADEMFVEEMIESFCKIIEIQRNKIYDLEMQLETSAGAYSFSPAPSVSYNDSMLNFSAKPSGHSFITVPTLNSDDIPRDPEENADGKPQNDNEVKEVFKRHCLDDKRSQHTINDYCSRIKNLWKSFYSDSINGELPDELAITEDDIIVPNSPLLNASRYLEELYCYISMKIASDDTNRSLLNTRAALGKFVDALHGEDCKKAQRRSKNVTKGRDFSKYAFEGEVYGKARLVLAVVKKYVEDHSRLTFEELHVQFPDHLQGSLGVVKLIDEVPDKYRGIGGVKRYFVDEDELIRLASDETVTVCTQWGGNIEKFIERADELGYKIERV